MSDAITRLNAALEGRYRIERELGEGGMATVYLAQDLKHERKVALKVLKPELAAVVGAERFLAEIKTTANLQHPHILPLFDSGEADKFLFYVMPYVEGESLRERLDREHQLPVAEAVQIATAVAHALDYAHRQGVIHRDIKPANILVHDGQPVISDFGIALALGVAGGGRLTETGLSLGTPHYMSPEQATGDLSVGAATDVYALGCVLYEMLVAEPPYTGGTPQAILGKIIAGKVASATEHRRSVPPHVDAAIRKALEKVPADRFASARDFATALAQSGFRHGDVVGAGAPLGGGVWNRLSVTSTVLSVALAGLLGWALLRPPPAAQVGRFRAPFEAGQRPVGLSFVDLTSDGAALVYSGPEDILWLRRWADLDGTPIRGTEGGQFPTLSPDDAEVAFVAWQELRVVPLNGGPSRVLNTATTFAWHWSDDGFVYFTTAGAAEIARVHSSGGGAVDTLTELSEGDLAHFHLAPLPGGPMAVFGVSRDQTGAAGEVWALDLETRERRFLTAGHSPRYAAGHLFFGTPDGILMAQRIDPRRAELIGTAVPITEGLTLLLGISQYAVSESGTLVYREGPSAAGGGGLMEPVWVTRSGDQALVDPTWSVTFNPGIASGLRISPDGTSVATIQLGTDGGYDIWVKQLANGPLERLTSGSAIAASPFWSPDGSSVAYTNLYHNLAQTRADGAGSPTSLLNDERGVYQGDWSPDGAWIVFRSATSQVRSGGDDILGFRPGFDTAAVPLVTSAEFSERSPRLSPNGRWLAYASDQTGRSEVYVRPFPNVDSTRISVSRAGGRAPVWARDGSELFFVDEQRGLVAARVETDQAFRVLDSQTLFTVPPALIVLPGSDTYDVAPDGRFLMIRLAGGNDTAQEAQRWILVQNVLEEVRERTAN